MSERDTETDTPHEYNIFYYAIRDEPRLPVTEYIPSSHAHKCKRESDELPEFPFPSSLPLPEKLLKVAAAMLENKKAEL